MNVDMQCLAEPTIEKRVDEARHEVLRKFESTHSKNDYYLEHMLNCFIAVVQYSVSFVFFDSKDTKNCAFHFLTDAKHQKGFEEDIKNGLVSEEHLIPFFPEIFGDKYWVSIIQVDTRRASDGSYYEPVEFVERGEVRLISTYIAACARVFFVDPWDVFATFFKEQFHEAVEASYIALRDNFREFGDHDFSDKYPPLNVAIWNVLESFPNEADGTDSQKWTAKLEEILRKTFADGRYGSEVSSRILHSQAGSTRPNLNSKPTNLLLGFRTFDRDINDLRWNAYPYNASFLVPEDDFYRGSYHHYFSEMRAQYFGPGRIGFSKKKTAFHSIKDQRCLYSKVLEVNSGAFDQSKDIHIQFKKVMKLSDKHFWDILVSGDGVVSVLNILKTPVGRNTRSLVDKCFSSSLICIDQIFEHGGLDRINFSKINGNEKTFSDIDDTLKPELLRIVSFYYLISGMASWAGENGSFNPRKIAALLVPVKMRGSVWAVAVHATYIESGNSARFLDNNIWMSSFRLMMSVAQRNQDDFDDALWNNTLRRITRVLSKHLGKYTIDDIDEKAIVAVNSALQIEQKYVPYALPQFQIIDGDGDVDQRTNEVAKRLTTGDWVHLRWNIQENPVFNAKQPWTKQGTRTFRSAAQLGLSSGLDEMLARTFIEQTKEQGTSVH